MVIGNEIARVVVGKRRAQNGSLRRAAEGVEQGIEDEAADTLAIGAHGFVFDQRREIAANGRPPISITDIKDIPRARRRGPPSNRERYGGTMRRHSSLAGFLDVKQIQIFLV